MIRKLSLAVAVVALGFVVAAPAQAGGSGSGAKKSSTIRVKNRTNAAVSVAPIPTGTDVVASAFKNIPAAGIGNFPVAPGTGTVLAAWSAAAALPGFEGPFGSSNYPAAIKKAGQKGYLQTFGTYDEGELPDGQPAPSIEIGGGPF